MKQILCTIIGILTAVIFLLPVQSFAQTVGDSLILYANPLGETIDQQIAADTVGGRDPNRVYVLQQNGAIDTVYFVNSIIVSKFNLTIIGKPNPVTGMLPVIAPGFGINGSSPARLFTVQGGNLTLQYLYLTDMNINGAATTTSNGAIYITGDSVTLRMDHCVMDGGSIANFTYLNAPIGDNMFISNCELRDVQYASPGRGGFTYLGKGTNTYDTISVTNTTAFLINGGWLAGAGMPKYVKMDHCTLFFTDGPPVGMGQQLINADIKNNIFYGINYQGADTSNYLRQIYEGSYAGNQMFGLDSLNSTVKGYGYTEADRRITIENNAYFWPANQLAYFVGLKSDTGSTITPPVWMSKAVTKMFSDKTTWPNLLAQNNMNSDPGFNPEYVNQVVDTLSLYVKDYWNNGGSSTHLWGLYMDDPTDIFNIPGANVSIDWASKQGYPVPENLKYSNTALYSAGTDGLPLGDLNWFVNYTGVKQIPNTIPSKFELSQNYPNPFNPTTNIKYSIPHSGFVSIKVYNILGQEVATLYQGFQKAGVYNLDFDASMLSSGVYLYRLQTNGFTETRKMMLLK